MDSRLVNKNQLRGKRERGTPRPSLKVDLKLLVTLREQNRRMSVFVLEAAYIHLCIHRCHCAYICVT